MNDQLITSNISRVSALLTRLDQRSLAELTNHLYSTKVNGPIFIWTLNLSHLREYSKNKIEFQFLDSGCLMVADGWPIRTLSSLLLKKHVERVPGVDIVQNMLEKGINFGVIGSNKKQIDNSILRTASSSESNLSFYYDQKIDLEDRSCVAEILKMIEINQAKYTFLALGFPKQELLFDLLLLNKNLTPGYYFGIGGTFEMLSGEKIRAPKWIQNLGLEWSWRFFQDPQRLFHRYLSDGIFFMRTILSIPFSKILNRIES